jgi:hypothetical protein
MNGESSFFSALQDLRLANLQSADVDVSQVLRAREGRRRAILSQALDREPNVFEGRDN